MKRSAPLPAESAGDRENPKRTKSEDGTDGMPAARELGEDLILEVLKRADARTLARAACVSRRWREVVEDERIWEAVCTRQWANIGCGAQQMRTVVLALGGFKKLHAAYLLPLLQPSCRPRRGIASSSAAGAGAKKGPSWGKDEVQLSMALLSIGFFERMNRR